MRQVPDIPSLPRHHGLPLTWTTTRPYCAQNNVKEPNNVNSLSNQLHIHMKQPRFWQEKHYIWEDIHSESIMKEFHLIKASREDPILKAGKVKVARETMINTKKWNPILTGHRTLSIPGLGLGFPWWPWSQGLVHTGGNRLWCPRQDGPPPLYKGLHSPTPGSHPKAWTGSRNGIYF